MQAFNNIAKQDNMVMKNSLNVTFTPGNEQIADILTKQLPRDQFEKLLSDLGLSY